MSGQIPVSVDRDFARFGSKSYAINKINSVEVKQHHPHGTGAVLIFGLLALICVLAGGPAIVVGAFFALLAFWAWRKSRIVEYQLFLMTSSSEAQALVSRDGDLIDGLRDRIERAMAGQLV